MNNTILCVAEIREGAARKVSFELITLAHKLASALGGKVEGAVVGSQVRGVAETLAGAGVTQVYVADDASLAQFSPEAYAAALAQIVRQADPALVLMAASGHGKELAARAAAKLGLGLATDCIDARIESGTLFLIRPIYAGKAIATVRAKSLPVMATLRPNLFPVSETNGSMAPLTTVAVPEVVSRSKIVESIKGEAKGVDLAEAKIVVSGGRGVKGPEGFEPLRQLSHTLGAALGASRAAVDSGWIDYTHQVGQTGKTVSPQLYIAAGISGAIQHLAGMSSSKVIVAINKDPEAPIFKIADYGIVGDLFQVIPELDKEFKDLLSNK